MHKPEVILYSHPLSTIFIDDNNDFLRHIALAVDILPFRNFISGVEGLEHINSNPSLWAHHYTKDELTSSYDIITASKLANANRFNEAAVVVVDFSMPDVNGLEICAKIENPYIKKILLTGVADERAAVSALNSGLINFYLNKREANLSLKLRDAINSMQRRYMQESFPFESLSEIRRRRPYLFDSEFADAFEEQCEKLEIVEYYPGKSDTELLLLDRYGAQKILHIEFEQRAPLTATDQQAAAQQAVHYVFKIVSVPGEVIETSYNNYLYGSSQIGKFTF